MRFCTIECDCCGELLEWDEVDTCRIEGELEQCCPYCGSTELIHLDHEEVIE